MPYIKPIAHSAASSNVTLNSDHIQEEEETELNENESEEPINTDDNVNPQASSSSQANLDSMASTNEKQSKKRRAVVDPVDKTLMEYLRKKKENLDRTNPEEDARKMFLLSLLPDINQLSDIGFRQFKIKSMLLIDELLANGSFNRSATPSYQSSTPSPSAPVSHSHVPTNLLASGHFDRSATPSYQSSNPSPIAPVSHSPVPIDYINFGHLKEDMSLVTIQSLN